MRKIVFFGGYASRDDIPEATRRTRRFRRVNWYWPRRCSRACSPARQRRGDRGAQPLPTPRGLRRRRRGVPRAGLSSDARPFLPAVTAPSPVLHRRGDRTVPIGRGRELASLLPNARFVALSGDSHLPWTTISATSSVRSRGSSTTLPPRSRAARHRSAGVRRKCCGSSLRGSPTVNCLPRRSTVFSEHTVHRHVAQTSVPGSSRSPPGRRGRPRHAHRVHLGTGE